MSLHALKALGARLRERDAKVRLDEREQRAATSAAQLAKLAGLADRAVRTRLGDDVAESLGPWRRCSSEGVEAAIGTPDAGSLDYYEGDAPGQDGEIRYRADRDELWYRPRMHHGSARIRDREHLARMVVEHSIYA